MWTIEGDEFKYEETVAINLPLPVVYQTVSRVDDYDIFLTDVALAEMESGDICHMVVRAGPLRVNVRTQVTYRQNERIDFVMVEGPPVQALGGSWEVRARPDGRTDATFRAYIKAGRAGSWLLKTASKYVERKALQLIDTFRQQAIKEYEKARAGNPSHDR